MSTAPTDDRRADLIAAHGADPRRWPAHDRPHWRDDAPLAEARALDAALDALPAPAPSDALRRRLLALSTPRPARLADWLRQLWHEAGGARRLAPAMALALALGVGGALGLDHLAREAELDSELLWTLSAFDGGGDALITALDETTP